MTGFLKRAASADVPNEPVDQCFCDMIAHDIRFQPAFLGQV